MVSIRVGDASLTAEIADTPAKRMRGLSGREKLDENQGMLFVFDESGRHSFWMADMRFPIDIVWITSAKTVVKITPGVSPASFPEKLAPETSVQYVLEVNAGWAARHNVRIGDSVVW